MKEIKKERVQNLCVAVLVSIFFAVKEIIETPYADIYRPAVWGIAVMIPGAFLVHILYRSIDAKILARLVITGIALCMTFLLMHWFRPAYTFEDAVSVLSSRPEFSQGRIYDMNFQCNPANDPNPSMVGFKKSIVYRQPYMFVFIEDGDSALRQTPKVHHIMFNPLTGTYKQYNTNPTHY